MPVCSIVKIIPEKKETHQVELFNLRKITSDRPVELISVQRYVMYCCVTHLLQPGVQNVLKKIGREASGCQIVKSQKISVFIMLSCWISSNNGNRISRRIKRRN